MNKYLKIIIVGIVTTVAFISLTSAQHEIRNVDSLGTIWIITTDKSGSMLLLGNASKIAENVCGRLANNSHLDTIDYTKDRFVFFTSGYSWDNNIGLGNCITTDARFDSCFIHHTDKQLHYINNKSALITHIKDVISANDYKHQLSFVSHIRVFSLVKAIEFLKFQDENRNFNKINIITITDDAEQNDQWLTEYKTLKKIDRSMKEKNKIEVIGKPVRNKVDEISKITTQYVYTELNRKGGGELKEVFSDEDNIPRIWIYSYATVQSQAQDIGNAAIFNIEANDGKKVVLTPLSDLYGSDSICFYFIDSIKINNLSFSINQQFNHQWQDRFTYDNKLKYNDITLSGNFQILYTDSIYGKHYKKISFTQNAELPSGFLISTVSNVAIILLISLVIFLIYWLLILPNKILFVIYSNQEKKYVIKRGYKYQWQKGIIPVLSCILYNDSMAVICKKHRNIKTKTSTKISDTKNRFLICSKYELPISVLHNNNKISSETDIEDYFSARSGDYSNLLKNIYRKTWLYKCREVCCKSRYKLIRIIGDLYVTIDKLFCKKYYYTISQETSNIIFQHPILYGRKFFIEMDKAKQNSVIDVNQQFNIKCLNQYYDDISNKKYNALICYGTEDKTIYWNVLLLDFKKNDNISLKQIYNTYQYKQELPEKKEKQILQNLKLLKKIVKKQVKNCHKIKDYKIDSVTQKNIHQFEITEVSYPGFIYLIEDTIGKQKSQEVYSPFKKGLEKEMKVFVERVKKKNAHLYRTFLPPTIIKGNGSLIKEISGKIVPIIDDNVEVLEIEDKKIKKFMNII